MADVALTTEVVSRPRGCKCNPNDWGWGAMKIPPVCRRYELDGIDHPMCVRCEHPKECHRV